MKKVCLLFCTLMLVALLTTSAQNFTQDRSGEVPILPESPEKLSTVIFDLKMKGAVKEKAGVLTSHSIKFYTTAYYRYSGKGAGGKTGGEIGFALEGISDATYQAIADETGTYFESKLQENGFTLEAMSILKGAKKFDKVAEKAVQPGVEMESQNLRMTKKVKAKVFTLNNLPAYKVEGTSIAPVISSMKTGILNSEFKIDFMSFGKDVSSAVSFDVGTTSISVSTLPSIHGNGIFQYTNKKLKSGSLSTSQIFRHQNTTMFTITDETKDGFWVVRADEAKYKQACVEFIKQQIDLMIRYYQEELI